MQGEHVMDPLLTPGTPGIQLKQQFEKYFTNKAGEFIRNASVRILMGQGEMFRDTVVVVEGIRGGEKKWEFLLPDGFFHAKAFDEIDGHIKRLKEEFAPRVARSAARYNTRQLHGPSAIRSVAKPKRVVFTSKIGKDEVERARIYPWGSNDETVASQMDKGDAIPSFMMWVKTPS